MAAGRVGLSPGMLTALACADARLGTPVPVTSGLRTESEQQALRDNPQGYPVAKGRSKHQDGTAVDVPLSFVPRLLPIAAECGLSHPYPGSDPIHFEAGSPVAAGAAAGGAGGAPSAKSGTATGLATGGNPWTSISGAIGVLGTASFWIRVLEIAGGAVAIVVGLRVLASTIGPAAKPAADALAKGGAAWQKLASQ